MRQFFRELKRRNVYKVGVTYAVVAFVVWQVAEIAFSALRLPDWALTLGVVFSILGFPIAVVLAWAFDLTPEGVRRTVEAEEGQKAAEPAHSSIPLAAKGLIALGLLTAAAAGGWYLIGAEAGPEPSVEDRSIAVLPFENMGGNESAQFTQGVHDGLLTRLSNISDLQVISRTSVMQYQDTELDLPAIADSLGVAWIVEGGVQQAGGQVQVNAQLIQAEEDAHQWAETYRRELTPENVFAIQSELTQEIARSLEARLSPGEEERVERQPTEDLEAYRLYVRGRRLLDQRRADSIREARDYFQRAVRQDSSYALAWSGLADARLLLPQYNHPDSLHAQYEALMPAIPEAKADARRALELAPDLAEGHTSLGYAYLLNLEGPAALTELRRAVELRPSYSQAQDWLGGLLLSLGRPEAALRHLELAVQLNPENQNAPRWLNAALVANRRYEEALAQARRRGYPQAETVALLHLRRWSEMRRVARKGFGSEETDPWLQAYLAVADVAEGDTASARHRRDELSDGTDLVNPLPLGLVHSSLGDHDAAVDVLGRIFEKGGDLPPPHLGHLEYFQLRYFYPDVLGPLREDLRFEELIREMNQAWGLNPDGSLPDSVDVSFETQFDG